MNVGNDNFLVHFAVGELEDILNAIRKSRWSNCRGGGRLLLNNRFARRGRLNRNASLNFRRWDREPCQPHHARA